MTNNSHQTHANKGKERESVQKERKKFCFVCVRNYSDSFFFYSLAFPFVLFALPFLCSFPFVFYYFFFFATSFLYFFSNYFII